MKKIVHFVLLILVLNISFLFSPKPNTDSEFCGQYVSINSHAGFIINCDAYDFVSSSISPSLLVSKNYVRQSRPLYVMAVSAIGYGIYYVSRIFENVYDIELYVCIYFGYICLNCIIVLISLLLFEKIAMLLTNDKISYSAILLLCVFIGSNFITKSFFWTAHQQMFAFCIPLLSIYLGLKDVSLFIRAQQFVLFFLLGLGMLLYGSFLVVFVICLFTLTYKLYIKSALFSIHSILFISLLSLVFFLPTAIWMLMLKYQGVEYYSHEVVRYRQIVWMFDALSISGTNFLIAFYKNFIAFIPTMSKLILFALLFVLTIFLRRNKTGVMFKLNKENQIIILNLLFFLSFFIVVGYNDFRLTFTLMPIMLCLIVEKSGDLLCNKKNQSVLFVFVSCWHLYNVFSYGPFS